jgi:MtrB/PioB family decaheme-associated outer membrane protein
MNTHGKKWLKALTALLSLPALDATAQTAAPDASDESSRAPAYDLRVLGGGRFTDVSGSAEKFGEYGEPGGGFVLDRVRLGTQRAASGYHMELGIDEAGQNDERYRLAVGRQGRYRVGLEYDAIPHRFARGTYLFSGIGSGQLQIADVAQEQLQANEGLAATRGGAPPGPDPTIVTTQDAAQRRIVEGMYSAAHPVSLGLHRNRLRAELEGSPFANARAWVRFTNEERDGTRVVGTGAYERWQDANNLAHTIDRFIVLGAELAEPLDYRTMGVAAGAGLQGESWLADVEYSFTQFRNFEDRLVWDNPFRNSDDVQVGGVERSRFARGQLVLPPNSRSHEVTASGATDLPMHGRMAASLSYGIVTQDDAFFPYTLNTAIQATDLAGTATGSAAIEPLPARDLNGDVRTIAGSLSATARPLALAGVTARYRLYRYDGRSDQIRFPGYAGFGESGWRRERADLVGTNPVDVPVENEVFDYWRHEADLAIDHRLSRAVSVSLEGGWEGWRFDHLRVDRLDEYSAGAGFAVKPLASASLKARYRFSDRSNDGYARGTTAENPEARGLLNFNWADRRRHLADARVRYSPSSTVSLGVLGRFVDDDYGGKTEGDAAIDAFRFGRTSARSWLGSADVDVTPIKMLSVRATYSFERRKEAMANGAKDDGVKAADDFGINDSFAPENYWSSDITETVNTVGAGVTVQLVPDRLVLDVAYDLSFA